MLSAAQARNLFDPVLNADPLHGVTGEGGARALGCHCLGHVHLFLFVA